MRLRNKVAVFKGDYTGKWMWVCPDANEKCQAPVFESSGSSVHWEIALIGAVGHVEKYHHHRVISNTIQTPPGGFHLDDNEVTLHLHIPAQRSADDAS